MSFTATDPQATELRNHIYGFMIMNIKQMLGQKQKPIGHNSRSSTQESPFKVSIVLTLICKLFRCEFWPLYLKHIPVHVTTRHSTTFLETFIGHGNAYALTTPHLNVRATLVLYRGRLEAMVLMDIKTLVLIAHQFQNIECTFAKGGNLHNSPYEVQLADRLLESIIQAKDLSPSLLSALEHDIANLYFNVGYWTFINVVFKKARFEPWMSMFCSYGQHRPVVAQGDLRRYVENLGLASFGDEERWANIRVSKEVIRKPKGKPWAGQ
jgi:hypothetical protein